MTTTKNLIFDADSFSFLNFKLGDSISNLQMSDKFESKKLGYSITTKKQKISGFFFCFTRGYREYDAFSGIIRKSNMDIIFSSQTTPQEIISIFGPPDSNWNDNVDETYLYERNNLELEFTWRLKGISRTLIYLIIETD